MAGQIVNFDKSNENRTIQFLFNDIFELNESYTATVDENGKFKIEIQLAYPQEFMLKYGSLASLFCSPGDSLFLKIDAHIYNDPKNKHPNGAYFVKFSENELGKTNQQISQFLEERPDGKYSGQFALDAVTNKSSSEYRSYIQEREQIYLSFLVEFNVQNNTTELFEKWANDKTKYESWDDLMRYRWENPYRNGVDKDSLNLPETYFNFLKDYNMNDNKIISNAHADFLNELSLYTFSHPQKLIKKANQVYAEKGFVAMFQIVKKMIELNSSGFTKELLLTKYYIGTIKAQFIKEFEDTYDTTLISDSYFLALINSESIKLKSFFSNKNTNAANLVELDANNTSNLLNQITSKYRGKVIYVDVWAPWCGPCMKEMVYSKIIQEYFKEKNVVFLFLANRSSEDSWKATIANKKLTGEHVNLTNDQFNILSAELGISGIPHYSLIDKRGNIVSKDAFLPSKKEDLIKKIEKLLEKDKMVSVSGGSFNTKREHDNKWEKVTVEVGDFMIDPYEVTIQQFSEFVNATSYVTAAEQLGSSVIYGGGKKQHVNWRHDASGNLRSKSDYDHPVIHVVPTDAIAYAKWCGKRLPTEAEWEYAARGGSQSKKYKYAGSNKQNKVAWNGNNSHTGNTYQVGLLKANEIGLYDMSGNVEEFCSDIVFKGIKAVIVKGGAFNCSDKQIACYYSSIAAFDIGPSFMSGFRCVKDK